MGPLSGSMLVFGSLGCRPFPKENVLIFDQLLPVMGHTLAAISMRGSRRRAVDLCGVLASGTTYICSDIFSCQDSSGFTLQFQSSILFDVHSSSQTNALALWIAPSISHIPPKGLLLAFLISQVPTRRNSSSGPGKPEPWYRHPLPRAFVFANSGDLGGSRGLPLVTRSDGLIAPVLLVAMASNLLAIAST